MESTTQKEAFDMLKQMNNVPVSQQSLCYYAGSGSNINILQLLLKTGLDPNQAYITDKGNTFYPLESACRNGTFKTVEILLNNGADINVQSIGLKEIFGDDKETPLIIATKLNNVDVVKLLIERGANVNIKSKKKINALYAAQKNKNSEIIELLKKAGAEEAAQVEIKSHQNKTTSKWVIATVLSFGLLVGIFYTLFNTSSNSSTSSVSNSSPTTDSRPTNPVIHTQWGQVGNEKTYDEYYIDNNGNKVYHGYRKNFYPNGMPEMIEYDQYGEAKWVETYDEAGNVLTSTK